MVKYFLDFPEFFLGIEGWVCGVYRIQTFWDFYIFFIFTRPLRQSRVINVLVAILFRNVTVHVEMVDMETNA